MENSIIAVTRRVVGSTLFGLLMATQHCGYNILGRILYDGVRSWFQTWVS